jgi:formate hydrogenlyase subunit 6/NADH:ubiquinone oxidoreductase subunit I
MRALEFVEKGKLEWREAPDAKLEGAKKRSVSQYILDFTKCSLCGSCVEACRDGAIRFSREYNLASTNKEDYIMDLFKRLENEALEADRAEGGSAAVLACGLTGRPARCRPLPTRRRNHQSGY